MIRYLLSYNILEYIFLIIYISFIFAIATYKIYKYIVINYSLLIYEKFYL